MKTDFDNTYQSLANENRIGFIDQSDKVYLSCSSTIIESLKKQQLLPFFGAGISNPPHSIML